MDDEYVTGDAGASLFEPRVCSSLKKGGFMVIKDRPCKITDLSSSKTGKHGSAKFHIVAVDIFTNKKYEEISPSSANVNVPIVTRKEYELVNIEEDFLSLWDGTSLIEDIIVPQGDVGKEIREKFASRGESETVFVGVVSAMGERQAQSVRVNTEK